MTDNFDIRRQTTGAPASTDPNIGVVETLVAANLDVPNVIIGSPDYDKPEPIPVGISAGTPYISSPALHMVPVPVKLQYPNRNLGSKLIYRAATGFEKAMADVDSERITQVNAELIRDIWDPWNCPTRLLPYLAWANGVEYWNDEWSETTRRAWIAAQLLFKSMRGTRKALEMAVDYAGRDVSPFGYKVTKVISQPQKVFSGPSLTRDQREAWLQNLPQVRVWRKYEQGYVSVYKSFYGASAANRLRSIRFCLDGLAAPVPSDAITRLQRVAKWVEKGIETDVRVTEYGSYFQLHRSGIEDSSVFSGRPFGLPRYFIPSSAHNRLLTIEPTPTLPWRSSMTPSLQAVTSEPERVKVAGTRKHSVFCDTPLHDFFVPSTASIRIYQRYAVLDPSVRELRRTPVQFMGVGRYGFPPFTAWAEVSAAGRLSPKAAGFEYWVPKTKFYLPHNGEAIRQVRLATQGAKALRDKIMLRIGPQPRFLAGERPVLAGIDVVPAGSI